MTLFLIWMVLSIFLARAMTDITELWGDDDSE